IAVVGGQDFLKMAKDLAFPHSMHKLAHGEDGLEQNAGFHKWYRWGNRGGAGGAVEGGWL
ncbi:MAG: hypothetical protein RL648_846, partial [Verrucomicrobiota bacterium]